MSKGVNFRGGITIIGVGSEEKIRKVPLIFGDETFQPGDTFDRIGSGKDRTTLHTGWEMEYIGMHEDYVLIGRAGVDSNNYDRQKDMFDDPGDMRFFIAPIYVSRNSMLMQSSEAGFWDIVPKNEVYGEE